MAKKLVSFDDETNELPAAVDAVLKNTYAPVGDYATVEDVVSIPKGDPGTPGDPGAPGAGFSIRTDITGYLMVVDDPAGHLLLAINDSGHMTGRLADDVILRGNQLTSGSVDVSKLATAVVNTMLQDQAVAPMLRTMDPDSGYLIAATDPDGKVLELAIDNAGRFPQWVVDRIASRIRTNPFEPVLTTLTVKKDGTGDYTTIAAALASTAAVNATALRPVKVLVYPGFYDRVTVGETEVRPAVTVEGTSRAWCIVDVTLPASASDADLAGTSTLILKKGGTVRNLTVRCRNARYAIHDEESGNNPDSVHTIDNCHLEHFGNQDVIDYRAANSLPAGNPWPSWAAYGHGSASGQVVNITDSTLLGVRGSWFVHNQNAFTKPSSVTLTRCLLSADDNTYPPMSVQGFGSGTADSVKFIDCEFGGSFWLHEVDSPWFPTANDKQPALHSEYDVQVSGSPTPIGWRTTARGRALQISSAATGSASTVRVSGTAVPILFGESVQMDGGGGLLGYIYGALDISGILVGAAQNVTVANTLGRRLGDCTTVNKTLVVTFESGTAVTITFDADYTAISNATILTSINTALGANGSASEWAVSQNERYPKFLDRERFMLNGGTTGIPRWSAVKYLSTNRTRLALMTTADPVSAFVGVALQPIPPGKRGRILVKGLLSSTQLAGISAYINNGVPIYLSDTVNGQFSTTGTRQVATGTMSDFATFTAQGVI